MLDQLARQIEALLAAAEDPLTLERICEITGCGTESAEQAVERIETELAAGGHGIIVARLAGGIQNCNRSGSGLCGCPAFRG